MKKYKRDSIYDNLKEYCHHAEEYDFIEISEWYNGDGFDVEISSKLPQRFQLTWGEFEAMQKLLKYLVDEHS